MSIRQPLLKGVRVLDISEGVAGPFASKLLADLGADTVKIERPGVGDVSRSFGPFPEGVQDLEKSASFFTEINSSYFNAGAIVRALIISRVH